MVSVTYFSSFWFFYFFTVLYSVVFFFLNTKLWEIVKDREAWRTAAHGVTKSWTRLSD